MNYDLIYQKIASQLNLNIVNVKETCLLLKDGDSVHFIARYRKELTNSLDEVAIFTIKDLLEKFENLEKRRKFIISTIDELGKLTDELKEELENADTLEELEDLYLPYKPKRKTRAVIAREKGLEPLAKIIMKQKENNILEKAKKFINIDKEINNEEEAIDGALDIIAEWINEHAYTRSQIRKLFNKKANITSSVIKEMEEEGDNYKQYFNYSEHIKKAPSHRVLAIFRGETEKVLKVNVLPPKEDAIEIIEKIFLIKNSKTEDYIKKAIADSYNRLMEPSIETEIRNLVKEKADKEAIKIFAENLRQLLMAPPLTGKNILAIDPGFRTGCKIVALDQSGKLLYNDVIYPHPPENKVKEALNKIDYVVEAFKIDAIAIGNGTAGRETERFIKRMHFKKDIIAVVVNESGASVYSASPVAREEFPNYDITVRSAVSIGRRLIDPLAELIKIDPKSIGVGQYQHDVNQQLLQKSLQETVESCVNKVGVNLNTASKQLLMYVSGIGNSLAKNIIDYRNNNGYFKSREQLLEVPRFGPKSFEQSVGFLRIPESENPLDNSAVHPESYHIVQKMARDLDCNMTDLISNKELIDKIDINNYITDKVGIPTLKDIIDELSKPGRDPRCTYEVFEFDKNVKSINDLKEGMILPGIVTNITAFGAFVDVGVHQDGLVHISQIANKFIKNPADVLKLNQQVKVKVLNVDLDRNRISFSMRLDD
ncbi:MAG: Tex family protein [Bacteroidales bacterium]|jgi:uncharacterized protein